MLFHNTYLQYLSQKKKSILFVFHLLSSLLIVCDLWYLVTNNNEHSADVGVWQNDRLARPMFRTNISPDRNSAGSFSSESYAGILRFVLSTVPY